MIRIAILGSGAIGQYIAAKFSTQADTELYLLARSNYGLIKKKGIILSEVSPQSELAIPAKRFIVSQNIGQIPPCDFVIICVKSNQTKDLVNNIQLICHAQTKIITLQNGLNFEEDIKQALPENLKLYSGASWIKVSRITSNHIRHDFGHLIKLGCYKSHSPINPITEEDIFIKILFAKANITVELTDNIHSVQLTKLALNVPYFIVAVRTEKSISEIFADKATNQLRETLQKEIIDAAEKINSPLDIYYINIVVADLKKLQNISSESKTKLLKRMKEELPQSAGNLLDFFRAYGIELSQLKLYYNSISKSS